MRDTTRPIRANAWTLLALLLSTAACGTTEMWPGDADQGDAIPDPVNEPRNDALDAPDVEALDTVTPDVDLDGYEVPDLPAGACGSICAFMLGCDATGENCLVFCERANEWVRACLLAAMEAGDCSALDLCYTDIPPPPECDPICEFVQGCTFILPVDICEDGCTLMSTDVHDCALAAMEADDCQGVLDCMLYPGGTEEQCDSVCEFALTECGLDLGISPELCSLGCQSGMLIEEGLLDCLGYGSMLRSCIALAGCAALYGYTMPGS